MGESADDQLIFDSGKFLSFVIQFVFLYVLFLDLLGSHVLVFLYVLFLDLLGSHALCFLM
jgi:hypothetical protein